MVKAKMLLDCSLVNFLMKLLSSLSFKHSIVFHLCQLSIAKHIILFSLLLVKGLSRPLFCFVFVLFTHNTNINRKSISVVFRIRTRGHRIVGHIRIHWTMVAATLLFFFFFFKKIGPFPASFSLFSYFQYTVDKFSILINFCQWLDSNRGPLASEATALPTEPQPLSYCTSLFCLFNTVDSKQMFDIKVRRWLWCWKRLLYQLSHNHALLPEGLPRHHFPPRPISFIFLSFIIW